MSTRIDHHEVLRRYRDEARGDVGPAMRSLPSTIDVGLAADVVVKLMGRVRSIVPQCNAVPARVIRAVLEREVDGATHLFLRLAVPLELEDGALQGAWQRALEALLDLDSASAWGSKQRRAKIASLARDAVMLPAIQGTVAHAAQVPLDMLAVLAADGGAASYDALVTHIDAAFASGDTRLDMLRRLKTHATSTPELDRLFAEIDGALAARNDASPALALGPVMRIGKVSTLFFSVRLSSTRLTDTRVPWVQGSIDIDSRNATWFRVWVTTLDDLTSFPYATTHPLTRFSATTMPRDDLGVGRCAPEDLPAWLARTAEKLGIEWQAFEVSPSNLRGKKRDLIARWLCAG